MHLQDSYSSRRGIRLTNARGRVRLDKAVHLLGYRSAFDFQAGMKRVEEWAHGANLADENGGGD